MHFLLPCRYPAERKALKLFHHYIGSAFALSLQAPALYLPSEEIEASIPFAIILHSHFCLKSTCGSIQNVILLSMLQ